MKLFGEEVIFEWRTRPFYTVNRQVFHSISHSVYTEHNLIGIPDFPFPIPPMGAIIYRAVSQGWGRTEASSHSKFSFSASYSLQVVFALL